MLKIEGIMPPIVTPFTENEEIDEAALKKEVKYMLKAGVHGLSVCGSTGEGYSMTSEEIGRVTAIAKGEVGSKIPVITGIITDAAKIAVSHAMAAKENGADALMVTPVHYVFHPTDEGTVAYFRRIGDVADLPIILYNVVPWNTVTPDLAVKLTSVKQFRGIKQSGGDIHGLADMVKAVGDKISIMSAIDDMLFPTFLIGAKGAIAAICTVAPELCVKSWEAAKKNDVKKGIEIHHKLLPVWRAVGPNDMPARVKEALGQLGRPVGKARNPLLPVDAKVKKEIHEALIEAKLLK